MPAPRQLQPIARERSLKPSANWQSAASCPAERSPLDLNVVSYAIPKRHQVDQRPKASIRVLLDGGSMLFRAGLRGLLEKALDIEIAAEAHGSIEQRQRDGAPTDIVLLDIDDKHDLAVSLLQRAREGNGAALVLIVTTRCDLDLSRRLVLAGVRGIVFKDKSADHLLTAIRKVHEGELWLDRVTTAQLIADMSKRRRDEAADPERTKILALTCREREVIDLVAQGLNNKRIAARMDVSEHTIRHHLTSIFSKLGLPDRLALAVYAHRYNLSQQTR